MKGGQMGFLTKPLFILTLVFAQLGLPPVVWQEVFALFGSARGRPKSAAA
jgi:hypothetical protein